MHKLWKVFDESTIEVDEAYECTNILEALGCRPGSDSFDLDRVYWDESGANDEAKILNLVLLKGAFLEPKIEIVLFKVLKNLVNNFLIFSDVIGPDENVIKINGYFAFRNKIGENGIHKCLKCSVWVSETAEHDFQFE